MNAENTVLSLRATALGGEAISLSDTVSLTARGDCFGCKASLAMT